MRSPKGLLRSNSHEKSEMGGWSEPVHDTDPTEPLPVPGPMTGAHVGGNGQALLLSLCSVIGWATLGHLGLGTAGVSSDQPPSLRDSES